MGRSSPHVSVRARILLLLVVTLLCLGGIEVAARIGLPREPNVRLKQFAKVVENKHEVSFEDVFLWDPERFWRLVPDLVLPDDAWPLFGRIANSRGLREDHDIPLRKPEGQTRVLFVGDSWTFGYLVAHDEAIPHLVEEELRQRSSGSRIECLNAGVPGYSLFQGWRFLETEGFDYEPDLIVLNFGWNAQTPWDGLGDEAHLREYRAGRPPSALRWSRACEILWRWLASRKRVESSADDADKKPRIRPRLTPEEFGEVLEAVHGAARREGADLMILVPATSMNLDPQRAVRTAYQVKQYDFVARFAEGAEGAPMLADGIRILRAFSKKDPEVKIFNDGMHTTQAANARLAEVIAKKIAAWAQSRPGG